MMEEAYRCVHCGFCLPTCPTYMATGNEADSPRGRIYIVRALAEGKLSVTDGVLEHLDRCVLCRRCELACPSGVKYSAIYGEAQRMLGGALTGRTVGKLERAGLRLVTGSGVAAQIALLLSPILPWRHLRGFAAGPRLRLGRYVGRVFRHKGRYRGRAALLAPPSCISHVAYSGAVVAAIRILTWNGFDVVYPRLTCCGAPQLHIGDFKAFEERRRANLERLAQLDADYLVVPNAGGCHSTWAEYPVDGALDIMELLDQVGPRGELGRVEVVASIQHSCHGQIAMRVRDAALRVLGRIPGVRLVGLPSRDTCCGAGAMYPDRHPHIAEKILGAKLREVRDIGPDVLLVESPTCRAHLNGVGPRIMYPLELLDESYMAGRNPGYAELQSAL